MRNVTSVNILIQMKPRVMETAKLVTREAHAQFWERLRQPWKPVRLVTIVHPGQVHVVQTFAKKVITVKQILRNRNYVMLDSHVR